ncbi:uncharacterized protein LOC114935315 [Nylanderia fulva]|uniref:uncharacterized protein LOC114935315 n=1 Tax=Nylanderia fulva TaxID=613905 RepID=UPI0010FBB3F5|nr:uncharacterized protein LOC114935315 [Nylanderia fulva]
MGAKTRLRLSDHRKSMRKGWLKRRQRLRQMLLQNTTQAENNQNTETAQNTENATNIQIFVADGILPDLTVNQIQARQRQMLLQNTTQAENDQNTETAQNTENATNIQMFVADGIMPDLTVNQVQARQRQMLLQNTTQAENDQNTETAQNTENATNIHMFVADGIMPDLTINQVQEEKADCEKPIEAYEEESICNENIEYCKNEDLDIDNECVLDNEEKEEHEDENTYNENIENFEDQDDLIIDNDYLSNRINYNIPSLIHPNIPEGRCIVDFSFMWNEMHRLFDDHAQKPECQFKHWQLVNFYRRGLLTQFWFQCQICKQLSSLCTEPIDLEKGINVAAAAGCVKADIGYSKMKKLCTAMNIKCMSEKTYIKNRNNLVHKKTVLKNTTADSF